MADLHTAEPKRASSGAPAAFHDVAPSPDTKAHAASKSSRKSVGSKNSAAAAPLVAMLMSHVQETMKQCPSKWGPLGSPGPRTGGSGTQ